MPANPDLVRSIYAAWERGDWTSVEWADPQIEYVMVDEPGAQVQTGVPAMAEAWRAFLGAWEAYRLEAEEFRALDDDAVLVVVRAFGRGKTSGVELSEATSGTRGATVFNVRDGKVVRLAAYFDYERAAADLGLEHR
jgi:ketosteroid isomerase-like protein